MKAFISARIVFDIVPLTAEQLAVLKKMALMHYDAKCQLTAAEAPPKNGIITQWQHTLGYNPGAMMFATFGDIDILLKVLEQPAGLTEEEIKIRNGLMSFFFRLIKAGRKAGYNWCIEIDEEE